ncbi:uncharacterized protein [Euphorbia lathyris]|uniref:uncharacterized protein isoform X2 n=1 Tax=Euphorbia lathyris TaxID=212925 RepID=UPI0033141A17
MVTAGAPPQLQERKERRLNIVPEVLHKHNYAIWSACMKSYLVANDLWETIEATAEEHEIAHEKENAEEPTNRRESSEVEYKAWRKKNAAAVHAIKISCCPHLRWFIINFKTAKRCWEFLATMLWPEEQIMGQQAKDPDEEFWKVEEEERSMNIKFKQIVEAIERSDINGVRNFLDKHPMIKGSSNWTAIHHATLTGNLEIVKIFSESMSEDDFAAQIDVHGRTVLFVAAQIGDMKIIEYFVSKNKNLVMVPDKNGALPLDVACYHGHKEATRYLYSLIPFDILMMRENESSVTGLLSGSIWRGMFDISLDLLRHCPSLATKTKKEKVSNVPIYTISCLSDLFPSGNQYVFWKQWIYSCIQVQLPTSPVDVKISIPFDEHMQQTNILNQGVKEIYDQKLRHVYGLEIVRHMCENISNMDANELNESGVGDAFFEAVKYGVIEIVIAMLKANPILLNTKGIDGNNLLMTAVLHRQGKIFSLVYAMKTEKYGMLSDRNHKWDGILHFAAILAPPNRLADIPGAALQMQRELQWYKEIKGIVHPSAIESVNQYGLKASETFTESHKQLVANGEKWMKETATSSTVVGALIITTMFTAAFTVPGGYIQDKGFPIFSHKILFKVFLVSDAISFFASSTSVLMFLGVLNSRYAEEDFLKSLPTKLMIGLSTLFISISSMMIAFCATLMLILRGELELVIPTFVMLAVVPISLFVLLQFPLLVEIFVYTYVPGIFHRKMQYWY